jgi:hypothetical protein
VGSDITTGQVKVDLEYDHNAVNKEIKDRAEGIPTKILGRKLKGHEDTPLAKKIIASVLRLMGGV